MFIIWTWGHHLASLVSSWASGVSQQSNGYSNSSVFPVGTCSDKPAPVHPFLMSSSQCRLLLWAVSCLSPGTPKEGDHPANPRHRPPPSLPPEGQLHRLGSQQWAANDPYDGAGQPLFGLHYPERDKQSFAVSLDNGPKSKSHRPSFFKRVINSLVCWDASSPPAPLMLHPLYSPKDFQLFCRQWFQKAVKDHWSEDYLQIPVSIQRNASYCVTLSNSTF